MNPDLAHPPALSEAQSVAQSMAQSMAQPAATPLSRTARAAASAAATATFREALAAELGAHRFGLWFEHGTKAEATDGTIAISAPNAYVADWIGRNFRDAMQRAAIIALGAEATISITTAANSTETHSNSTEKAQLHTSFTNPRGAPLRDGTNNGRGVIDGAVDGATDGANESRRRFASGQRTPRSAALRRLEDFIVGDSNRLAFAASQQVGEGSADAPPILFLHGECGVGKTHLIQGLCRRRSERAPKQIVRYVTAEQFTNEYIAAVRDGSLDQFRKRLRRLDLLAIDDVHFLANKTATQAEFLHTIDAIDLSGARVALVSDEHPRHIRRFSQSLVSRFLSGMVVKVERPDRGTRSELVRRLASERGLDLTTAAEDAVAGRCAGSIREIEGAITRLGALVELDGVRGQIGPGTVERLLGHDGQTNTGAAPIRLAAIVEAVCDRMRVNREDLLGSGRHARTVVARGVVAHLARELTTHSYPEIARALGRDTHSTVHTAAKRLKGLLDADARIAVGGEAVREVVDQLRHDLARGGRGRSV